MDLASKVDHILGGPREKAEEVFFFFFFLSILFSWQPRNSKICSQILSRMVPMADVGH